MNFLVTALAVLSLVISIAALLYAYEAYRSAQKALEIKLVPGSYIVVEKKNAPAAK